MKLICAIALLFLIISCSKEESQISDLGGEIDYVSIPALVDCSAEKLEGDKFASSAEGVFFDGGACQSNEFAKSGEYCVKLDSVNPYGFGLLIADPKAGEFFRFSVWQKEGTPHGTIFVSTYSQNVVQKNRTHYIMSKRIEDGWVMHSLSVVISPDIERIEIVLFSGNRTAFFDDFKVERFESVPENEIKNKLSLNFPIRSSQKIQSYIKDAKTGEVIRPEHKKYVKAYLFDGEANSKVKVRLKGDWTDHLSSGKVSCRVKMKGSAYNGLRTFSLQHPKTRNYLDEWLVHKMAEKEDVLTTTFDFVNVDINNVNHGIYALEEHFDKQLLESRNRREGPILKFDESGVWSLTHARMKVGNFGEFPFYEQSQIKPFKSNRTLSNPKLKNDFFEGARLLRMFKNGEIEPEEVFDLNQLAKYQVIIDMCSGVHASAWHNRRFYFNPVTQKLEHILYDMMPFGYEGDPVFLYESFLVGNKERIQDLLDVRVIKSAEFRKLYFENFERMTSPVYLDELFAENEKEIIIFQKAIQNEEPSYLFAKEKFYKNAAHLRSISTEFRKLWENSEDELSRNDLLIQNDYSEREDRVFFEDIALNAYLQDSTSIGFKIKLENFHLNEIEVCGYESDHWPGHVYEIDKKIILRGFGEEGHDSEFLALYKPKRMFYKVSNLHRRYYDAEVMPWRKPEGNTTRMRLQMTDAWKNYCSFNTNKAIISGEVVIDQLLYFPESMDLEIAAGAKVMFENGGGIIVNGNFSAIGSISNPIEFFGDSTANKGLTILNADLVEIKNVIATNLSNLDHENWTLTGAITIYESRVNIQNLQIINAKCEDALNIIRSEFNVFNLLIDGCKSDGFDADFCSGYLTSSIFKNTGNDCIDFSGSQVTMDEIYIRNSGDKGVSGGEKSTLSLNNVTIDGAITGIASKDQSHVYGENVSIRNADYSLMVFQKKPEYGPAQLQLEKSQVQGGIEVIDLKSVLTLNGKVKEGVEKVDIDALYARFE